jgi:hypothetical protein
VDWEALEAEFADIDAELADGWVLPEQVAAAAHRRRRQVVLYCVIAAMVVAAALVSMLLVLLPTRPISTAAQPSVRPAASAPSAPTQASVYAAVLTGPRRQGIVRPVWVASSICRSIPTTPKAATCADAAIPPAVQRKVEELLGPQLRFTASPPLPRHPGDAPVVEFGRLDVRGDWARLGIETFCGPVCGEGQTLVLRLRGGHWRVTGSVGPRWVS